eukprot:scaffold49657_cov55-Attheya_sp.AAC.1
MEWAVKDGRNMKNVLQNIMVRLIGERIMSKQEVCHLFLAPTGSFQLEIMFRKSGLLLEDDVKVAARSDDQEKKGD